ncbi:aminoglycoside N(3)-acetyltransferase [Oceanirhabdus sp. W0125-5]|uniref:aminoglycoside N(3)-acetyltransferase n=1 Tax=Oceanirhabdus sp. W0125-5 TaxID=2999116 RepID=UPI0022F333E1|nr:AAC(3) family N-acetyltransferase [Oceanirhabdus sp. W0125-5]WBW95550.1 AAC(3) family N-acetyltransferase [Oceanirhabdus sp. W0125-5]
MSLENIIKKTEKLSTRKSLSEDFIRIGLRKGDNVIVHSSLSSIGWVCGGPVAVIQALMDAVTESGTIIMPTHSDDYSDPALWENPPIPEEWVDIVKETMPAFDPKITPTFGMGAIVECFRTFHNVLRSNHHNVSFAAWGKNSNEIIQNHSLDFGLGEGSPLARLYDLDAKVILLGTTYEDNTSFHLCEYRAGNYEETTCSAPIMSDGKRVWKEFKEIDFKTELFYLLGKDFEQESDVTINYIGEAKSKLFNQKKAVDFGVKWFEKYYGRCNKST